MTVAKLDHALHTLFVHTLSFPCSIGSEETKNGALMDRQIQRIDGAVLPKVFGEPLCFNGKCLWLHSCTS
jgi:hypothetical protein